MKQIPRISRSHLRDLLLIGLLLTARPDAEHLAAGGVLFVLGLAVRLWAKATLHRNRELTVDGPYALCRHPFYLGNLLLETGLCVMAGRPLAALFYLPLFALVYRSTIRREEAYLRARFPEGWKKMKTRPALAPRMPRRWAALLAPWSARTLAEEREWSRALRLLALPLLILVAGDVARGGWLELIEWEPFVCLTGAGALHLAGRIVYQRVERRGRRFAWNPRLSTAAVGALSAFALVLLASPALNADGARRLAERHGAELISTPQEWRSILISQSAGPYLIDDDVLEGVAETARPVGWRTRILWSGFEIYHLSAPYAGRTPR